MPNAGVFLPDFSRNPSCLACARAWPRLSDGEQFIHQMPNGQLCKCPVRNPEAAASQTGDSK